MATVYRCDRCHTEALQREEIQPLVIPRMNRQGDRFMDDETPVTKELCASCMKMVIGLVEPIPRQK